MKDYDIFGGINAEYKLAKATARPVFLIAGIFALFVVITASLGIYNEALVVLSIIGFIGFAAALFKTSDGFTGKGVETSNE